MNGVHFAHPVALALLAVAPALAAIFRYGDTRRRAAVAKFGAQSPGAWCPWALRAWRRPAA